MEPDIPARWLGGIALTTGVLSLVFAIWRYQRPPSARFVETVCVGQKDGSWLLGVRILLVNEADRSRTIYRTLIKSRPPIEIDSEQVFVYQDSQYGRSFVHPFSDPAPGQTAFHLSDADYASTPFSLPPHESRTYWAVARLRINKELPFFSTNSVNGTRPRILEFNGPEKAQWVYLSVEFHDVNQEVLTSHRREVPIATVNDLPPPAMPFNW